MYSHRLLSCGAATVRIVLGWVVAAYGLLGALDAHAALGHTPGSFTVTPTGAATYTIPLWAPPGPQGVGPQLALAYNSQSGSGPVGRGWTLSGLSSIGRCNRTVAQDGVAAAVTLTYADPFCMDGMRLRLTSSESLSTYGQDGTTYQTEVAEFSNVTAHGVAGNGPAYFTVRRRNGWTYEYGNTTDSRVLASGSSTAAAWMLDKVTDRNGNAMVVTWRLADANLVGMTVPASISWTPVSHGANSYSYTMSFVYTTVSNATQARYVAGTAVQNFYLLQSIAIQYTGAAVKAYVLGYTPSSTTGRETLTSFVECTDTSKSNCLQPTQFTYQSGQAGVSTTASTIPGTGFIGAVGLPTTSAYDFNGDGINDILYGDAHGTTFVGGGWVVSFGSPSGYSAPVVVPITQTSANRFAIAAGNVEGGTKAGFVAYNSANTNWVYYTWNGTAFVGTSLGPVPSGVSPRSAVLADVNGDGLPDLVYVSTVGALYVQYNSSANGTIQFNAAISLGSVGSPGMMSSGWGGSPKLDFTGSGQADILLPYFDSTTATLTYNVAHITGNTLSMWTVASGIPSTNLFLDLGDYNDDGCMDLLFSHELVLSGCNGTTNTTLTFNGDTAVAGMNWNGARRAVIVNHGGTLGVYESVGNTLGGLTTTTIPYDSSAQYQGLTNPFGGGLDALLVESPGMTTLGGPLQYYTHNGAGQPADLLSSATDGYGNSVSPTYVSMVQHNYSTAFGTPFPPSTNGYTYFMAPLYVTNQATFSDPSSASSGTYQQTFWYYDAWLNQQGRGFTGFKQFAIFDSRTRLWTTTGFHGAFPEDAYLSFQFVSHDQAGSQLVHFKQANVTDTVLDSTAHNQRYFEFFNTTIDKTYEVGGPKDGLLITTDTTTYQYDNFGNAFSTTELITDNDSTSPFNGQTWTKVATQSPDVDTTNWCLTLSTQTQVAYSSSVDTAAVTRTTTYPSPDTFNCRYTQAITEPNSSTYKVTETFGYDSFGNVNSDTLTGIGMGARQTLTNWGTTGQFPVSVTDPGGAVRQLNYDFRFGLESQSTDVNNLSTSWIYDGFGRITQETYPDQTFTAWTYQTFPNLSCTTFAACGLTRSVITRTDKDTAGNPLQTYEEVYDAVDRAFERFYVLPGPQYNTANTTYDSLGRIASRTKPYFYGNTSYIETYSYDVLNRPTGTQHPASASNSTAVNTIYQYAGDTSTITDENGHAKTLLTDPNGWLRRTMDATGYAVNLGYDAAGSHNATSDSLGNTLWSATYQYGRGPFMVSSSDADLGQWGYTYDALGEKTHWTDAKGQSFSASYDVLSRMTDRYEPDLYSHWSWGTGSLNGQAAHNSGLLQGVCTGTGVNPTACTASGYAENEVYDQYSRLATRAIQIPGDATYTYTQTYNATTGYLDTFTYPTNPYGRPLQVKYTYANGIPQSVTDVSDTPNVTLWTANSVDAAGRYVQETFGNRVIINHSFDAVTSTVSGITAGVSGGSALQNNSYLFDNVGNLIQRQDNNAGTTENAFPDVLNRLDHTVGDSNTQLSYDTMGRLASWSVFHGTTNVNDYTTPVSGCSYYANAQPHAIRRNIQGSNVSTFCYDRNGNLVSAGGAEASTYTWMSYNQPNLMSRGSTSATQFTSQFFYDANHQRWKQIASYSGGSENTTYIGGLLEKMSNASGTQYRHYVPIGNNFVVYVESSGASQSATYYVTRDHQGSSSLITDQNGTLIANEKFSATGINETSSQQAAAAANITRHGYTGQEGLDNIFLKNFNGRVLDGSAPKMLSPDPNIPDLGNTLAYNRYAYARYNPLTRVDPSGFMDEVVVASFRESNFPVFVPDINLGPWGGLTGGLSATAPAQNATSPAPITAPGVHCDANGKCEVALCGNCTSIDVLFSSVSYFLHFFFTPSTAVLDPIGARTARLEVTDNVVESVQQSLSGRSPHFLQCMGDSVGSLGFAAASAASLGAAVWSSQVMDPYDDMNFEDPILDVLGQSEYQGQYWGRRLGFAIADHLNLSSEGAIETLGNVGRAAGTRFTQGSVGVASFLGGYALGSAGICGANALL